MMDEVIISCPKCDSEIPPYIRFSIMGRPFVRCPNCRGKFLLPPDQYNLVKNM